MDSRIDIEERVAARLSRRYGVDVSIDGVEDLPSAGYVARYRISGDLPARSVVVKRVTDRRFDRDPGRSAPSRALNEIAASSFFAEQGVAVGPRLIDWDETDGLVVFEDLGPLPTLEFRLWDPGYEDATPGLLAMAESLAVMHRVGMGCEPRFQGHQQQLGTMSPRSDSTTDQRRRLSRFEASLREMDVEMAPGFKSDLGQIESLIHDERQFRSIIHADAGPQNFLYADGAGHLIDLEFVTVGNVFCDVVGPRLGFPQTMYVAEVPNAIVAKFEDAYREAVMPVFTEFTDQSVFTRGLVAGAGHWAMNRWSSVWNETHPPEQQRSELLDTLARNHLVLDGLTSLTSEVGMFEGLGATIAGLMERARAVKEIEKLPVYPAFEE